MNIWTGLLFLDGAVADIQLARELVGEERNEALSAGTPFASGERASGPAAADTRAREHAH